MSSDYLCFIDDPIRALKDDLGIPLDDSQKVAFTKMWTASNFIDYLDEITNEMIAFIAVLRSLLFSERKSVIRMCTFTRTRFITYAIKRITADIDCTVLRKSNCIVCTFANKSTIEIFPPTFQAFDRMDILKDYRWNDCYVETDPHMDDRIENCVTAPNEHSDCPVRCNHIAIFNAVKPE